MVACSEWLNRLCNLNVSKSEARGMAPHKPLLLLSIMDMVEEGKLKDQWVIFSPELVFRFQDYWRVVYDRQQNKPDMRMPFHALGGTKDQIWKRFTEGKVISKSRETTKLCLMDESLLACMQDSSFRQQARIRLITTYFNAGEQISLCERLKIPEPKSDEISAIKEDTATYKVRLIRGRDGRFRSSVLLNYNFTCALTGYSLNTTKEDIVEAAHIHQHAESRNDDPSNGLALTPDAHWMFDRGLWTAIPKDDKFIIIIALNQFKESSPVGRTILCHHEKPLYIPDDAKIKPNPRSLEWHKRHRFLGVE